MTDRESLELAAKAAGIEGWWDHVDRCILLAMHLRGGQGTDKRKSLGLLANSSRTSWDPLTDDGDALRLAVKLGFCVSQWPRHTPPDVMVGYSTGKDHGANWIEDYDSDPLAATRRAIVRAAAEIGKAMP